jgi:hypothetical protein
MGIGFDAQGAVEPGDETQLPAVANITLGALIAATAILGGYPWRPRGDNRDLVVSYGETAAAMAKRGRPPLQIIQRRVAPIAIARSLSE